MSTTNNYEKRKLNVGTEAQFEANKSSMPVGSEFGITDPISIDDLDSDLKGIINGRLDLLWTNASPSSSFAPQTITISNANDYKFFIIAVCPDTVAAARSIINFIAINGQQVDLKLFTGESTTRFLVRFLTITNTSFVFENAAVLPSFSADNTQIIPYKIYGVK